MTTDAHKPSLPALFVGLWRSRLAARDADLGERFIPTGLRS